MKILVTGAAGFIGYHLVSKLIANGHHVIGLDNINDYYDVNLKYGRLQTLGIPAEKIKERILVQSDSQNNFAFLKLDITHTIKLDEVFRIERFDIVCHLAAQAGVRYSLTNPQAYVENNIVGFGNILECCRHYKIKHLVYASSSSVYGLNKALPFSPRDSVDHPISLYAASKKSNELMAHVYSYLYELPVTGLRFFTAYGPWGRPDMALFVFTKAILDGRPIDIFNDGDMKRDFTYIDDVVKCVIKAIDTVPRPDPHWNPKKPDPSTSHAPYRIYNIGNSHPVKLMDFITALEEILGKTSKKNLLPLQPGDVPVTWAEIKTTTNDLGYRPCTDIKKGILKFVTWYRDYYGPKPQNIQRQQL